MPNIEPDSSAQVAVVHVAVGVVVNRERQVLIALRHDKQHQGGLWEFPGGKVRAGETVKTALDRELREEVNITVRECAGLLKVSHDYGDKKVLLDVLYVSVFSGQARGCEGQAVKWVGIDELDDHQFPAANAKIVSSIKALLESSTG